MLAAGAGSRAGGAKVLRRDASGVPWVALAVRRLLDGGCSRVIVVLGASADRARELVPAEADPVVCGDWAEGLSTSLRTGLEVAGARWGRFLSSATSDQSVAGGRSKPSPTPATTTDPSVAGGRSEPSPTPATEVVAAMIVPVDVPDGNPLTVRRLLAQADASALVRSVFDGRPGHPVLIGRDHWAPLADSLTGDSGASEYLSAHDALRIECGDLEAGDDIDE